MAGRGDDSFVEVFYDLFMHLPAWTCVPVALMAYLGVQVIPVIFAKNQFIALFASSAPTIGLVVAVLILLAGFKAAVDKRARRKLLAEQTGIASIRELSWSSFELLVGQAYRQQGYEVIETGGRGPDGGIDLKLLKNDTITIVQCKQWKAWKVGVKPIRELYGVLMAERADQAFFVTSGVFTREAREFSQGKPLELIDGEALSRLIQSVQSTAAMMSPTRASELQCKVNEAPQSPKCPRCNESMVLRTAKRGANVGSQYWGCSGYPKCTGTLPQVS
ncbi:restriction endonuclease [Verrucomicrobiota bacterium sgz303538]